MILLSLLSLLFACTPEEEPQAPLLDLYAVESVDLFPEGVAFHEGERAFFVSSLGNGTINRIDADGTESTVFAPDGTWVSLGVRIGPDDQVWACAITGVSTPDARSEVWALDAATGERTLTASLDRADGASNCNDLAFVDGKVLVTDREAGHIYAVTMSSGAVSDWMIDAALAPETIGMNAVMITPAGSILVGKYAPAKLMRMADASSEPVQVVVSGDALTGADGMVWDGDDLLVAANQQVFRLTSSDDWVTASAVKTEPGFGIAALTIAEGQIYGLQGEVIPFVLGTDPQLPFAIHALDF